MTVTAQGPLTAEFPPSAESVKQAEERANEQMEAQETKGFGGSVNLNIDVNQLLSSIGSALNGVNEREAFVRTLLETVISYTRGRWNVMVFNMQQSFDFNPDYEWTWFDSRTCNGIQYGFWVFRGPVRFVNQGDGGWINWGFYGLFNRDGGIVDFAQAG